ncbi:MAG: polyprenyl synthetase family protein [Candidatus Thermoplasmatota archaeon]|nr:polyprenyl synthetase family protein [Candidatus Thermoplasmatota archaeon]
MPMGKSLTFQGFVSHVQEEMKREIDRKVKNNDVRYALEGGKLLRPIMLILSFRACSGENNERYNRALESALGVELAHSASLIHDDIMDGDVSRRGKPALYIKNGIGSAILTGHQMISNAFRISVEHGLENAKIFLDTWDKTVVGQIEDIDLNDHLEKIFNGGNSSEMLVKEYFKVIEMKTASLFAAACRAGAIEAQASQEVISLMAEYGKNVGLAYQLADDLVDIAEGKIEDGIIMPLITAYGKNLNEKVIGLLKNGKISIEEELEKRGTSLQEVYQKGMVKYVKKSQEIASSPLIPDNIYKRLMKEAPIYITNKMTRKVGVTV